MKLSNFIEGLNILKPHWLENEYVLGADHDIIYLLPTSTPLSDTEIEQLTALGFFNPEEEPEGWAAFV